MRRIALLIALATTLSLGAWHEVGGGTGVAEIDIITQNSSRTVFEVSVPGIEVTETEQDGRRFNKLTLPGQVFAVLEEGRPEVPKVSVLLARPNGARVSVRASVLETRALDISNVQPLQPPLLEGQGPGPLVINESSYLENSSYPDRTVELLGTGTWRDLDVANIEVFPVKVNPARGEVEVAARIRVEVDYDGGSYPRRVANWLIPTYAQFIDNFNQLRVRPYDGDLDYTPGIRYLVLRHSNYAANSLFNDSLLGWIKQRGYEYRVIVADGMTAAQIRDSIRAEYQRNDPPLLRWALLVGEANNPSPEIPTGTYAGVGYSDFYYSDLLPTPTGDNYPEIGISRLSPSSSADLDNQVRKILTYQTNPPSTNNWLDKLTMAAHKELYPGKYSGCIRGIYHMPMPYWTPAIVETIMGQYLGNAAIASVLNEGRGIMIYRGHGNTTSWTGWGVSNDYWGTTEVSNLTNGDMTPVVWNICCCNGEIYNSNCLTEHWMRKYPGGAAASLAATQASYTYPNHGICSTMVRATCDTWTITVPGVRDYVGPVFDVGGIMQYMDAYIAKYWGSGVYIYNAWMYLMLGDPSMPVWSGGMPQTPTVTCPDTIALGPDTLDVTVTVGGRPVEGTIVCAWKGTEVYVSERTNSSGLARLYINPTTSGSMLLTVSEGHAQHSTGGVAHTPIVPAVKTLTTMQVSNVGVTQILTPTGTLDSGTVVTPQVVVKNFGSLPATFPVEFTIGGFYSNIQTVVDLVPGDSVTVSFANWTAEQLGTHVTRCSTGFVGDQDPANDTLSGTVTVSVLDVGALAIEAPIGSVDSGTVVTPRARFKNYSSSAVSFAVTFRIGVVYSNQQTVTDLDPGEEISVSFNNWTAGPRGNHSMVSFSVLTGDIDHSNDTVMGDVTVLVEDVAVTGIVAPTGTIDSGDVVTPQAWIRNYGMSAQTFDATFRIGGFYTDTQTVTSLAADDSVLVSFTDWTAEQFGTHTTSCSTELAIDMKPANDRRTGTVTVGFSDVGTDLLVAPAGAVDSGATIAPQATVYNAGAATVSFPVQFRFGGVYTDTQQVVDLAPDETTLVSFSNWTATQRGTYTTRCSTMLATDQLASNNAKSGSFYVRVTDGALTYILAPNGIIDSGRVLAPEVVVTNHGTDTAVVPLWFLIHTAYADGSGGDMTGIRSSGSSAPESRIVSPAVPLSGTSPSEGGLDQVYTDSAVVTLAPGAVDTVTLSNWTATTGSYTTEAYVAVTGDQVVENDTLLGTFEVLPPAWDVGLVRVARPLGTYEIGYSVSPAGVWHNFGSVTLDFEAWAILENPLEGRVYYEKVDVTGLEPGEDIAVSSFPECTLDVIGPWTVRCSSYAAQDTNAVNDWGQETFTVQSFWREIASLPLEPSGRPIKRGGWLAFNEGDGRIYAGKGYKTPDFYGYDPVANAWIQKKQLPYQDHPAWSGKPPDKGARGVTDGGNYVYVTQGNNTLGFWRYDIAADSWAILPDVPLGISGKKVKGGTDMVFVSESDGDYVYLLKGYRTDFLRFSIAETTWQQLDLAPAGQRGKWNKGSWLVYDGSQTIYGHKARYNELWSFDLGTARWDSVRLTGMPLIGRSGRRKKSKDGGSAALLEGFIYALKGGNTQEFWRYGILDDAWVELDSIPSIGSTGSRKRVKQGGDMTIVDYIVYAFKGNKTVEFWRYSLGYSPVAGIRPVPRSGVMSGDAVGPEGFQFEVRPNPLTGRSAVLSYQLPRPGPAKVTVFDAAGRALVQRTLALGRSGNATLNLNGLSAGVYLLRLDSPGFATTRKLVVE